MSRWKSYTKHIAVLLLYAPTEYFRFRTFSINLVSRKFKIRGTYRRCTVLHHTVYYAVHVLRIFASSTRRYPPRNAASVKYSVMYFAQRGELTKRSNGSSAVSHYQSGRLQCAFPKCASSASVAGGRSARRSESAYLSQPFIVDLPSSMSLPYCDEVEVVLARSPSA